MKNRRFSIAHVDMAFTERAGALQGQMFKNGTKTAGYNIFYRVALKYVVLKHYSKGREPLCACCGCDILEYLTIDHIKGGGWNHRNGVGRRMTYWVWKNNFPKGFQVLCTICNASKQKSKTCKYHMFIPSYFKKNVSK